jgi:hypothetical protein
LLVHRSSEFDPDYLPVYFRFSVQSNSAYWSFMPGAAGADQVDQSVVQAREHELQRAAPAAEVGRLRITAASPR